MILLLLLLSIAALGRPQVRIFNTKAAADLGITFFNDQNSERQRLDFDSSDTPRVDVPRRARDNLFNDVGSFVSRTLESLENPNFDSREDQVSRSRTRPLGTTRGTRRGSRGRDFQRGPSMTTGRAGLSLEDDFEDDENVSRTSFSQTIEPVSSVIPNRRRLSSVSSPRTTRVSPRNNVNPGRRPDSFMSSSMNKLLGTSHGRMADGGRGRSSSAVPIMEDVREGPYLDGSYFYRYQTGNGIFKEERRIPTGPNTFAVTGSYSYMSPDGAMVEVNYVADEFGFRVVSPNGEDPLVLRGSQERRRWAREESETDVELNSDFRLSGSNRLRGRSSRRRDFRL